MYLYLCIMSRFHTCINKIQPKTTYTLGSDEVSDRETMLTHGMCSIFKFRLIKVIVWFLILSTFLIRVNRLSSLPRGLGSLPSLEILDLTYNNLNENSLPANFFLLKGKTFHFWNLFITSISANFTVMAEYGMYFYD